MQTFEYTAQTRGGATISGSIQAESTDFVVDELTEMGLSAVEVQPGGPPPAPRREMGREDFIFFNEQLASLAETGICLDTALQQLARDVGSRSMRRVLEETAAALERGEPLDRALEEHGGRLPALYSRVIRAGTKSGQLAGTLFNLSHHLRLIRDTRRLIAEAVTYPACVLVIAFAVLFLVLAYLIPNFRTVLEDFGTELPRLTLMVFAVSASLPAILLTILSVVVILLLVFLATGASARGLRWREAVGRRVPIIGSLVRDSHVARFLRSSAFAVANGIPLPETLRLAADASSSATVMHDAEQLAVAVERGDSIYDACNTTKVIPPIFGYTVKVCADGDNLAPALVQLAQSYEARVRYYQSVLRSWLAPVLIVVVGSIIAVLIVSIFLPMKHMLEVVT